MFRSLQIFGLFCAGEKTTDLSQKLGRLDGYKCSSIVVHAHLFPPRAIDRVLVLIKILNEFQQTKNITNNFENNPSPQDCCHRPTQDPERFLKCLLSPGHNVKWIYCNAFLMPFFFLRVNFRLRAMECKTKGKKED